MPVTKAELKQQLDEIRAERDSMKTVLVKLEEEKKQTELSLEDTEAELTTAQEKLNSVEEELKRVKDTEEAIVELEDKVEQLEWQREEADKSHEMSVLVAKDQLRRELSQVHSKELEARDYLIQLLKERVAQLQGGVHSSNRTEYESAHTAHTHSEVGVPVHSNSESLGVRIHTPNESGSGDSPAAPTNRVTRLATINPFSGEEGEDFGGFPRWLRKLERMSELHSWSDREKLIQFELLLSGRAERIYELLPGSCKSTFQDATTALQRRLEPVGRDALRSAQLIRRRQRSGESVDIYAQDFERLFEQSYGRRTGMDEESRNMLKRDLFVQGLLLKWQEKVLPSAETFADALHQARASEEQTRQLANLHGAGGSRPRGKETDKETENNTTRTSTKEKDSSQRVLRCHKCRSTRHLLRDCPMRKQPEETPGRITSKGTTGVSSNVVTNQSSKLDEEEQCKQLHQQWAEAEYQRIQKSLQVDTVTGSVGPLYYCQLLVAGQPVRALVDSGSSATIMSLELFQEIARKAGLSSDVLHKPDVVLRDYNQHPLRVGAVAHLEIEYGDKKTVAPVYINAGQGQSIEPFLCGTNILFFLGLLMVDAGVKARTEDGPLHGGDGTSKPVKLLRTERIPGWSGAVLRVSVEDSGHTGTMHFIPSCQSHVLTEEAVIDVREGQALIPVLNYSRDPVKISPSSDLGTVTTITEDEGGLATTDCVEDYLGKAYAVTACSSPEETGTLERKEALLKLLERVEPFHRRKSWGPC